MCRRVGCCVDLTTIQKKKKNGENSSAIKNHFNYLSFMDIMHELPK